MKRDKEKIKDKIKTIRVIVSFLYDKIEGKDDNYYKNKAFNDTYNLDTPLTSDDFMVYEYMSEEV